MIYARKEPTTDSVVLALPEADRPRKARDTVFYADRGCTVPVGRIPWHYTGHPARNAKRATLNGYRFDLQWVK